MPTQRVKASKAPVVILLVIAVVAIAAAFFAMSALSRSGDARASDEGLRFAGTPMEQQSAFTDRVVMTLAGNKDTYVLAGEKYLEPGCHASDPKTGNITPSVVVEGAVDTSTPGDYTITYTATTEDGLLAKTERKVHVVPAFESNATRIPVLMYHYVYKADAPPENLDANHISDAKLAEQLNYLHENNYYYPSFQELRAWVDGTHTLPAKSIILTFDDGETSFLQNGIPLLEQYQVPATSFVVAKDFGNNTTAYASEYVQFQSHSYNMHRGGGGAGKGGIIHAMSQQDIYDDIVASQNVVGGAVAVAYPFGDNHATAWAALQDAGILCAFTVKNDRVDVGENPMALDRVRISGNYEFANFKSLVSPV